MKAAREERLEPITRLSDFPRADAVYVGTVRSPSSRGSIASISLPHLPRDYRSITADDIPGARTLGKDAAFVPILAEGRVRYKGEPVALIVGPDEGKVAEAISLTRVRVDEDEAEYTFETHDSARIVASGRLESGDVEKALSSAAGVIEGEYRVGPQDHYYPEPQGSAAVFDYDKLVVFSSTQWPFHVRSAVAAALGVKPEEVIVRSTLLGPHLDGKLWYPSLLACHAALAAVLCGRPALLLLSRTEDFLYTTKRSPVLSAYRAGIDAEGRLVAMDAKITMNTGAYGPMADELVSRALLSALGPYSCPNARIIARAVSTDLPPMGAFTGLGSAPVTFAIERMADECAAAADMDPSDWRAANAARKGDDTLGPTAKRAVPYDAVASRVLAASDYPRKHSSFELIRKRRADPSAEPGYGIGFAFGRQLPAGVFGRLGSDAPTVEVTLTMDSTLTIRTSSVPSSKGAMEIWRHSAAFVLGLDPRNIAIESESTDQVPDTGPVSLSRNIGVVTRLIESACEGLRTKRFREALPITVRKSQRARSGRAAPECPSDEASWGGAVVELELDPVDGSPDVRGVWFAVKAGRILSRPEAMRTMEHDIALALGLCVGERLDLSAGPASEDDVRRYRLPRSKDVPPIHVDFIDDDSDPKGIGELAYALVPPAFANALGQALDAPWNSLPMDDTDARSGGRP